MKNNPTDNEAITQLIDRYESVVRENERLILEITRVRAEHKYMSLRLNACFRPEHQEYVALFTQVIAAKSQEEKKEACDRIRELLRQKEPVSEIQRIKIVKDITGMSVSNAKHFVEGYNEIVL